MIRPQDDILSMGDSCGFLVLRREGYFYIIKCCFLAFLG